VSRVPTLPPIRLPDSGAHITCNGTDPAGLAISWLKKYQLLTGKFRFNRSNANEFTAIPMKDYYILFVAKIYSFRCVCLCRVSRSAVAATAATARATPSGIIT